jgi:SAM-dependent methyltransferase
MRCKTSKYEDFVSSYFSRVEIDYGTALMQYWIKDHIQKAKEGLPPYVTEILNRNNKKSKSFDSITVLDLCCGWGEFVANCLINGVNCFGMDKDESVWFGNKLLEENNLPHQLVQGDGFLLPFKKETFDIVFSFTSIEHIKDPEGIFQSIYSVLKENGMLFFSFPNAVYPVDGHTMLWGVPYLPHDLAERYVKFRRKRKKMDQWDVWYHTKRNVIGWLRMAGFRKVERFIPFHNSRNKRGFLKQPIMNLAKKLGVDPYAILSLKAPMVFMIAEK